ncbi:MAG: CBS domain-containing protein, partial [Magnetospirillum sp.]|nr:CBS domain-containing protein [Magnetospirillum sp.]
MASDQAIDRIVQRKLLSCSPATTILDAARTMTAAHCSSIVIVEDGKPVGIWTERDALSVDLTDPAAFARPIAEAMSFPVKTVHCQSTIGDAGMRFKLEGVRHFVVIDDTGDAVGIISQSDVILGHGVEHFLVLRSVRSAITRPMVIIPAAATLTEAVSQLHAARADAAIVLGDEHVAPGIITERDVIRLIAGNAKLPLTVGEVASRPLLTIFEEDSLLAARGMLEEKAIRHIGITDKHGDLIGLLSFSDILATLQYEYVHRLDEALKERDAALIRSRKDL